ncbi:hypothetical protein [Paraburkholderia aspalathi]|uniref:hypothetical protein n=1 Tax=Paraburkholderia aspalathi TaxID=1324617 RepID=UPI001BAE3504|nr:hypothetical protein [Paraburkholderia aspalathi]
MFPNSPVRDLTSIAAERAQVTADLATAKTQKCTARCTSLSLRRVSLSSRLDALNVAFDEARRPEQAADRLNAARDHQATLRAEAINDPVTDRVAQLLGTSTGHVDLTFGIAFGAMMEFAACLGWLLALQENRGGNQHVAMKSNAVVAPRNAQIGEGREQVIVPTDRGLPGHGDVTASRAAVATGNSDNRPAHAHDYKVTMLVAKTVSADLAPLAAEVAAGRSARHGRRDPEVLPVLISESDDATPTVGRSNARATARSVIPAAPSRGQENSAVAVKNGLGNARIARGPRRPNRSSHWNRGIRSGFRIRNLKHVSASRSASDGLTGRRGCEAKRVLLL